MSRADEGNSIKEFVLKPFIKHLLLGALTLIIGGLCSSFGNWDKTQGYFYIKLIALIIFVLVYIGAIIFYFSNEANLVAENKILKQQKNIFEVIMVDLISIFQQTSKSINVIAHEIKEKNSVNLNLWNFDNGCELICERVYKALCNLQTVLQESEVCYVKLIEEEDGIPETKVMMSAYFNKNGIRPTIYKKVRDFTKKEQRYFDASLFESKKSEIEILMDGEAIDEKFEYCSPAARNKNKKKYSQYIGIPVFCEKVKEGKMVGLLEIVCLNGSQLAITEEEVNEMASKYFVPYANLLLLLHKIEKVLKVVKKEVN